MIVALATQTVVILVLLGALLWREREHSVERATLAADHRDERMAAEAVVQQERTAVAQLIAAGRREAAEEREALADRHDATVQELLTRIQRPDVLLPPQRLVEAPQEQEPVERDEFDLVGAVMRNIPAEDQE